jgi:serine/threonine protein kinase, bacterial
MSYCLNPACPHPINPVPVDRCQACGSPLKLQGRYRILSSLGQGGFGATFLARDESLPGQPNCVIKQLRPNSTDLTLTQMSQELFEREAKTLGRMGEHPQIPGLLAYFSDSQSFYLVQEYVNGSTLQQEVKRNGPFTEIGVKQFLSEILPLIEFIHSKKVIHRDIKPSNIIRRSYDGKLVLIDFGAVKDQVTQSFGNDAGQTALTSYAIGTAGFAPPEQMAMRPVFASDIYALGVTCLYLLTGCSPKDLNYDPATGEISWQYKVKVSDRFSEILTKMLDVSVRDRFQTASDVLQALDIEPYFQSLANSMTMKPGQRLNPAPDRSADNGGKAEVSPAGRAAQNIRSLRSKENNPPLQGSVLRQSGTNAYAENDVRKLKAKSQAKNAGEDFKLSAGRLNAESVKSAYRRGHRDFASQDLSSLNLQKTELSGANFYEAILVKANFKGASLENSKFGRACLHYATLKKAQLQKAYFSHADLQYADLRGADLREAYLSNANLRGANLCGANLKGAVITEEQLSLAKTNWLTIKPNGKRSFWL